MEVKPGYKWTEIGAIPAEWEASTIGEVAAFAGGSQPAKSTFRYSPSKGYVRLIQIRDYKTDEFETYIPDTLARKRCSASDIMIGRYGPPIFQILRGIEGAYNVALIKATPSQCIDREFFYHVLQQDSLFQLIDSLSRRSSGQTGVEMPALRAYGLPLPPLAEQCAIATALSDVDALLGGLGRLIAKKRDLKQAAMQQFLTGQTRLPDFSGEWVKTKISEMCEYVDGVRTAGGDVGYVEIGDIDVERKSYSISQKEKLSVPGAVKVPAGTLLISTVRPTRGAIAVTQSSLYVSSAFCRLRPANAILFHLVCQPAFLAHLGENSIGGTYPTCRDEAILDYETALPGDPREQTAIAAVLSDMDAELAALVARRDKTRDLKQAMMQELLTGKTRLVKPEAAHA